MKTRILIFIDWFLPGTRSGGPVRSYANLINHFENEYEFMVITRDTDYCETEPYKDISVNSWNQVTSNTKVYYISKDQLNKQTLKKIVAHIEYDVAYINGIYSWFFSVLPLFLLKKEKKKKIVAARGMLNPQAFSVKKQKKKVFLFIAKLLRLYNGITFHATNNDEKEYIKEIVGQKKDVIVAPNLPRKLSNGACPERQKEREIKLVSIARISKEKGTLHTLKALSAIKDGKVTLDLYGPIYDSTYWEQCKSLIETLPSNINVTHKGSVDGSEVPEVLKNYHFFIMPSEGENFGHAILEALSCGCPVIISDMTPWKELQSKKIGWDISLQQPEKFISAIETAASMDQETYNEWSAAAYNFSIEFCSNPEILEANRRLFEE